MTTGTKLENPRYRVKTPNTVTNGMVRQEGEIVDYMGWPSGRDFEPLNESARRIAAYYSKYHAVGFFPKAPFNPELGTIQLPGVLPGYFRDTRFSNAAAGSWLPAPVPEGDVIEGMPAYEMKHHYHLGTVRVSTGDIVHYLAWPVWQPGALEPVNDAAREVVAYYEKNQEHQMLTSSPWCEYRQAVFLPEIHGEKENAQTRLKAERQSEIDRVVGGMKKPEGPPRAYPGASPSGVNKALPLASKDANDRKSEYSKFGVSGTIPCESLGLAKFKSSLM